MSVAAIIALIQGIIAAAPQIAQVGIELKNFISGLFKGGVITAAEQNALHAFIETQLAATKPAWWEVDADPVEEVTTTTTTTVK